MNMEEMINKYFRPGRLPHIWCPGCGNGVVTGSVVKAIAKLDLSKDDVAVISGIGCSSRASGYLDFNTVLPPQYRPYRCCLQQQHLRHDRRPVFADDSVSQQGNHRALRHD